MDLAALPLLRMSDDPQSFADAIGESFRAFGFAIVRDHGIDAQLIERAPRFVAQAV